MMVTYEKNVWQDGDISMTVEENGKINAVVNADKLQHIEDGISNIAAATNTAQTTADSKLSPSDVYSNTEIDQALDKKLDISGGNITGDLNITGSFKINNAVPEIVTISKSGIWTIKKYPGGFCEIFGKYTQSNVNAYTNVGNVYYFKSSSVKLPVTFKEEPLIVYQTRIGNGSSWSSYIDITTTTVTFYGASISGGATPNAGELIANAHICGYL